MDQKQRYQIVLNYVQQKGPVFPIDVAKLLGSDSIIASALLSEMASKNCLKKTNRQIGDSLLYYLDGQEEEVRGRLSETLDLNERKLVQKLESVKVTSSSDLEPMERYIMNRLQDFVFPIVVTYQGADINFFKHYSVPDSEVYALLEKQLKSHKAAEEPKTLIPEKEVEHPKPKAVEKREIKSDLEGAALEVISRMGGRVINKRLVHKNRETDFLVEMQETGLRYLFKLRNKKSISDKDLSLAFAQVMEKKLPLVLLVTGELSKKAQKYKEESCGDLIKIVNI